MISLAAESERADWGNAFLNQAGVAAVSRAVWASVMPLWIS